MARIKTELGDHPLVARLISFVEASGRGIVRGRADVMADPRADDEEPTP
jgi:hypothetical protein